MSAASESLKGSESLAAREIVEAACPLVPRDGLHKRG